ncbi:hypothetical protein LLG96_03030 [bacterium]|nr:hypothetical protein [bacterium]
MNIPNVQNQNNTVTNNTAQTDMRQARQTAQNTPQNQANTGTNTDTYTRSPMVERLKKLNDRKQNLQQELTTLQQQNPVETGRERTTTVVRELNGIERDIQNLTNKQPDNTERRQMEAIQQYTEQNQTITRNQNNPNNNVKNAMGLLG